MKNLSKTFSLKNIKSIFSKGKVKHYLHQLVTLDASPSQIAISVAFGVFIGLLLPMGLQTIVILPIAGLFEFNIVLAVTASLISNPITMIPLYYTAVKIGEFITGITISWSRFEIFFENPSWSNLLSFGNDGLAVFFSGSSLMGLTAAILTYFLILFLVKELRNRRIMKSTSS
ncbi:MAG: DUF2062 domain-containing protein [Bacteroidetes bacterium]|nr:DUF2062 domain-containing protein [Bacteroidota bacterium]